MKIGHTHATAERCCLVLTWSLGALPYFVFLLHPINIILQAQLPILKYQKGP